MLVQNISRNICKIQIKKSRDFKIAMLSDIHWDNPHCKRKILKSHLDYCVENNIPVFINGDFFCLMQGRGDPRRNKGDIRPEHNNPRYLDSIIETAIEWFTPYKDIIKLISYGNHETSIIRFQETDILRRFVDLFNYKNNSDIQVGGYSGWIWIINSYRGNSNIPTKIKYHHGAGGGGVVTKGAINLSRALMFYEGFDVYTQGHIHENWARDDVREYLQCGGKKSSVKKKCHHLMVTGTYKDEYDDAYMGFHIERGRNPRVIGGRIMTINYHRKRDELFKIINSSKFSI